MTDTTNNEAPRRQTPTEFTRELMRAIVTKEPVGKSETIRFSAPTTGALAGQVFPDVQLARDPDETMDQWRYRMTYTYREALKWCLVFNDESYRDELLREALQEIRS